jgi:hypothetical protein
MSRQHVQVLPDSKEAGRYMVATMRCGFVVGARLWKGCTAPPPDAPARPLEKAEAEAAADRWEKWLSKQAREAAQRK